MNDLVLFQYEGKEVRVVTGNDGEPWFVAKDLCDNLNLANIPMAVQGLEDDEKLLSTLLMSGQNRETWIVNESGMYSLILRSNKPEAKKFKKWVTGKVLPAIRTTGSYAINLPKTLPEALRAYALEIEKSEELTQKLIEAEPKVSHYEAVMSSTKCFSMREAAKLIGAKWGQNDLFAYLRDNKYLISTEEPYQEYMDRGYFKLIIQDYTLPNGNIKTRNKVLMSQKGLEYFVRLLTA